MNALPLGVIAIASQLTLAADEGDFDPNSVTPGVIGFGITFLIAAATVAIVIDMTRRVRRTRYREEIRERLAAEQQAGAPGPAATPDTVDPADPA